jgi:hypothetical protein
MTTAPSFWSSPPSRPDPDRAIGSLTPAPTATAMILSPHLLSFDCEPTLEGLERPSTIGGTVRLGGAEVLTKGHRRELLCRRDAPSRGPGWCRAGSEPLRRPDPLTAEPAKLVRRCSYQFKTSHR